MAKNQAFQFFIGFGIVMFIIVLSYVLGEFVVGKDARLGQIVIFLSVLLGMVLYYLADFLSKKSACRVC